ncbi:MAG TPA: hypothetical protein DCY88_05970, partial [Cyanobacteria bacterium UBA11372]|nr:hypothetical protein [Cyanobacteria bacterium UBA11372]
ISEVTRAHNLTLHMDGARFANAIVGAGFTNMSSEASDSLLNPPLRYTPADITWRAGVDILSFGATKNGAMAAEAVIFFNRNLAETFHFRRKRGGHLFSKMRFLSAQLEAYITDNLWRRNASHANKMAAKLADGLNSIPGVNLLHPVEANEIFAELPEAVIQGLYGEGFQFYRWEGEGSTIVRLVTAFNTREEDVAAFIETAKRYSTPAYSPAMGELTGV